MIYPKSVNTNHRYRGPIESEKLNIFYGLLFDDLKTLKETYDKLEILCNEIDDSVKTSSYIANKPQINKIKDFLKECDI